MNILGDASLGERNLPETAESRQHVWLYQAEDSFGSAGVARRGDIVDMGRQDPCPLCGTVTRIDEMRGQPQTELPNRDSNGDL